MMVVITYCIHIVCVCVWVGGCVWKRYAKAHIVYVICLMIIVRKLGILYTGKFADFGSQYIQ